VYNYRGALTLLHVYSAILDNKIPIELANHVPPAALNAGLPKSSLTDLFNAIALGTPAALAKVPGITPSIEAAVGAAIANAYAAAYAYVYYAAVAVGLVGLIGTLFLLWRKSPRDHGRRLTCLACCLIRDYDKYFTSHVPRQIYKSNQTVPPAGKLADEDIETDGSTKHA
jgi:hypothetical protein